MEHHFPFLSHESVCHIKNFSVQIVSYSHFCLGSPLALSRSKDIFFIDQVPDARKCCTSMPHSQHTFVFRRITAVRTNCEKTFPLRSWQNNRYSQADANFSGAKILCTNSYSTLSPVLLVSLWAVTESSLQKEPTLELECSPTLADS